MSNNSNNTQISTNSKIFLQITKEKGKKSWNMGLRCKLEYFIKKNEKLKTITL